MDARLTRKERLRGKSAIDNLFSKGKSFVVFPLRAVYTTVPAKESRQAQQGKTSYKRNIPLKKEHHSAIVERIRQPRSFSYSIPRQGNTRIPSI